MCGISGFNFNDKNKILQMNKAQKHRGPDGEDVFCNNEVSLGHVRLSILDLSDAGSQPMAYKDCIIVYNGEVYNYIQIKNELEALGHNFESDCDTEVILHSYCEWGEECVHKFNGMWAFCIYDKHKQAFFISRDRFGIKPLYYYYYKDKFIFASELKAIRVFSLDLKIDKKALNFYFYQKYIGGELTIFENVRKLKPGHNLKFDLKTGKFDIQQYYNLEDEIENARKTSQKERIKKIKELVKSAVINRLVSDVPVGSFLSGGVDSSVISSLIAKEKKDFDTFSIGFKEKSYDELDYSKIVAEYIKTNHHYEYMEIDESLIEYIIANIDEPFGDSSILPTYLLSKITRSFVTVSLSGDAGDEVFGGYDTYKAFKIAKFIPGIAVGLLRSITEKLPVSHKKLNAFFKIKKMLAGYVKNSVKRHLNWMSQIDEPGRRELLGESFINDTELFNVSSSKNNLLSVQLNDIHNYLPEDILKKVDTATMLNSLEARVPFLDYRLVPLVLSLPDRFKIRKLKTKWLLKKIAGNLIPSKIVNRKKRGFTVPVYRWIKESKLIRRYLINDEYYSHMMISQTMVLKLLEEQDKKVCDNSRILWLVFVFNFWMEKNFK